MLQPVLGLPCQHVNFGNTVNLIPEKLHTHSRLPTVSRKNLQHIPPHPKCPPVEIHIIAGILRVNQPSDYLIPIPAHARAQGYHHLLKILWLAKPINAGHAGNNNHVLTLNQRCCGRKPKLVYLLIDRGILGNVGIRRRNISLRLVIIIVGHKILHCILREVLLELAV